MKKHLSQITDLAAEDIYNLLEASVWHQENPKPQKQPLTGHQIGLWFSLPSTRTKISFLAAINQLGASPIFLNPQELQISRGETLSDTVKILGGYLDALVIRTENLLCFKKIVSEANIPVINALTTDAHPCQMIADLLTIQQSKGCLKGIKIVYAGDANNICDSWILSAALLGLQLYVAVPKELPPSHDVMAMAKALSRESGASIVVTHEPDEAFSGADVLYTDVWHSMGDDLSKKPKELFEKFQINASALAQANPDCAVMHCLPAHRGEEITSEVLDGKQSVVWEQAANRLPTQKAILCHYFES